MAESYVVPKLHLTIIGDATTLTIIKTEREAETASRKIATDVTAQGTGDDDEGSRTWTTLLAGRASLEQALEMSSRSFQNSTL